MVATQCVQWSAMHVHEVLFLCYFNVVWTVLGLPLTKGRHVSVKCGG